MRDTVLAELRSSRYRRYLGKRTIAVICHRLIRFGSFGICANRRIDGRSLRFELRDHTQCLFFFGVSPEPENSALMRAIGEITRGDLIDVGANYGQQPYEVQKSFRRMLLFEPNPAAAGFLRELFNDVADVEIIEMGVSDTVGNATLFFPDERQSGVAAIRDDGEGPRISLITIDEALRTRSLKPCLIKIDVEGFEENVLRGAEQTIRQHLPILAFESDSREKFEVCRRILPSSYTFYQIGSDVRPALRKVDQIVPVLKALLKGSRTNVTEVGRFDGYISLVFGVPAEKDQLFRDALAALARSGVGF